MVPLLVEIGIIVLGAAFFALLITGWIHDLWS